MLYELIDFLLLGSILLSHSAHELLHPCHIGLSNRVRFIATGSLPCDIHDALATLR